MELSRRRRTRLARLSSSLPNLPTDRARPRGTWSMNS